jgi:exopolyphosphatase / guanosine-5'-triphosphate,3'-diphosphate pyrophosphatase
VRLATIDLGTNTVRLLVAELGAARAWTIVHHEQRVTRLGEGLAASGELQAAPMARTAATVGEYVERARTLGAARIRIVATSAVREARNGAAFAGRLERETGEPVEVVRGDDEARLTVRGVLEGLGRPAGARVVFDIGGGSTEYIRTLDDRIVATVSLTLGVVALAERFAFPGPAEPERYRAMAAEIGARLRRELTAAVRTGALHDLVGTAGTVTTLAALDLGLTSYDASRVQAHRLTREAVARQRERLAALPVEQRAALPCLEPGRADLILPGLAIVEQTMALFGVASLVVSDAGLREGMMAETAEKYV